MNPKLKSENYQGLGGINIKYSPYITGPLEFLDIQNMDFQMPGALTQRWGSTMYFSQTLTGKISALAEFSRLNGSSYIIYGATGALFSGSSIGTNAAVGFSALSGYASSLYPEFSNVTGEPPAFELRSTPFMGNGNVLFPQSYEITYAGHTLGTNNLSVAPLNNFLFCANGEQFYRFDGVNAVRIGSPFAAANHVTVQINNSATANDVGIGATGSYAFYCSFVNDRGFEGQIWPITVVSSTKLSSVTLGGTFIVPVVRFPLPNGYNLTSLNTYVYWSSATLVIGATSIWSHPYGLLSNRPFAGAGITSISGVTFLQMDLGTTLGGQTFLQANQYALPDPVVNSYYPIGFTAPIGNTTFGPNFIGNVSTTAFYPQFVSAHQNRLFLSGFSAAPSLVVFSDVAEPEGYPLENNFEVRTDDSDVLVGQIPYSTKIYFFKRKSFHVLIGDSAINYQLQAVSVQYGALNSKCIITFGEDEVIAFLDRKGIIFFNGSKPVHASVKMQPYFDRMNYSAAMREACMVHDKLRNQIICAIPIDGSSVNNIKIVYDYLANSWTTETGTMPTIMTRIQGRNTTENVFYGSYSGIIAWFGSSFTSDNGTGFTCYIKPRFNHEMGDSIQKQFRRLYVNMDPPGSTLSMNVNFFQDYGTSKVLQSTFVIGEFQNRLEYGISAKAITFELYHAAQTVPIRIYGYTLEERLQRKV